MRKEIIEAKQELIIAMKKSLKEEHSFSYYSKNIIQSMNALEEIVGKMMHDFDPGFERDFWLAHDHKDMNALKQLNALINKTIDNLRK